MTPDTLLSLALAWENHESRGESRPAHAPYILVSTSPTRLEATVYNPIVCLILQGGKETTGAGQVLKLRAGNLLVVSQDTPVMSWITTASPAEPYVALVLSLSLDILRTLYAEAGDRITPEAVPGAVSVSAADPDLLDCLARRLVLKPGSVEADILGPLLHREFHFRLLQSPQGAQLRQLLSPASDASRIARAIASMRSDISRPLSVPDLARNTGMAASSFHAKFRAVTGTSPLRFLKDLRLTEARRLLSLDGSAVTQTAFAVGYESATQFSREYARKFGVPPRAHLGEGQGAAA